MSTTKSLSNYQKMRDFKKSREPSGKGKSQLQVPGWQHPWYVVQEHHARNLHYDFRLELDGVLKSWAVPKGPSMDPKEKRLAVEVEDHPLQYATFQGKIPKGQYGAGNVYQWDKGQWTPPADAAAQLKKGRLEFTLKGKRLTGKWLLIRTKSQDTKQKQWLLIRRSTPAQTSELKFIPPQLAQLVREPPNTNEWVHELKFDGYRVQAHVQPNEVKLFTRNANDWTMPFFSIAKALENQKCTAILDGEIVWQDDAGRIDFQRLQNSLEKSDQKNLVYYVFDLLFLDGEDFRAKPLEQRRQHLEKLLRKIKHPKIKFSQGFSVRGVDFLKTCCELGLEGAVSKKKNSLYTSGRQSTWVKAKCQKQQEFVIAGFTDPEGSRPGFGALLLGVHEHGKLRYAGRVGTGFSNSLLVQLASRLKKLKTKTNPFALQPPKGKGLNWVKPTLVCEVAFANWTDDHHLRAPVFRGLRSDKPPTQVTREKPKEANHKPQHLSNPDKIYYADEKITKRQVADYYIKVASHILPHILNRPLALLRCPNGTTAHCFFQKHKLKGMPSEIESFKEGLLVTSERSLQALVQWGTIEIHPWNCRLPALEKPDQIIIDLDPGPHVDWDIVVSAAFRVKKLLDSLKLKSFLKVSGGKGLHIHFPFQPLYTWDQVKTYAQALASELAAQSPEIFVTNMSKKLRTGKIFVDYLRNGRGATAIAPYALRRAKISAVAMPISWNQLQAIKSPYQFTLKRSLQWLKTRKQDPWLNYYSAPPPLPFL